MKKIRKSPTGIYATVQEWKRNMNNIEEKYIEFGGVDPQGIDFPKAIYDEPNHAFIQERKKPYFPTHMMVLKNARVCGVGGSVITRDNSLLSEVSFEFGKEPENHSIFTYNKLPRITGNLNQVALLSFCQPYNYYHWMFDILPRFYLLRQSHLDFQKIIINPLRVPFQYETLNMLGIHDTSLVACHQNFHVKVNQLQIPFLPSYLGYMPKWACEFLRSEFLKYREEKQGYERLYISRESNCRKVTNENEIMELLGRYGFKKITLENMSVKEQISLFSSAEVVISPHGAALANLVFCKPGTKVIELFPETYIHPHYRVLSHQVDLNYYYLVGKSVRPVFKSGLPFPIAICDHIEIKLEDLFKTLQLASV